MKIGYPCINNSISRNSPSTFRLASYSEHKLAQTIEGNLIHLNQILKYNVKNNLLFFRISQTLYLLRLIQFANLIGVSIFKQNLYK